MPFIRPSLQTLIERVSNDIETRIEGANVKLRRSVFGVLSRVIAGVTHGLYGYIDYLSRQILPDMAERAWLERHAGLWLKNGRKPPRYASGEVIIKGLDGTLIPAETLLRSEAGQTYLTEHEVEIKNGEARVSIFAEDLGQIGNAASGVVLSLASPILHVESDAIVSDQAITGGVEEESDDELLARLLLRLQNPPCGGAKHDYEAWAREVPGVTRAWVYPLELGLGTVTLRFVRDDDDNIIPEANEIATVQAHIDACRPVTASVLVAAPIPDLINFEIAIDPATSTVKAAVEENLRSLLKALAVPSDGLNRGKIFLSHINEVISKAAGEEDHTLIFPTKNIMPAKGHIAIFGSIKWV